MEKRSSGILLPVSSLPSPYGVGTLGKPAYEFVDFLKKAGQSWWQVLPIGPTSYGDSPYQSFSCMAGNPYFIDLDELIEDRLLLRSEVESASWGEDPQFVDYGTVYQSRFPVLRRAAARGMARDAEAFLRFRHENPWVENYALFMAVKSYFGMRSWTEWDDEDIRLRKPEAVARYSAMLKDDVDFYAFLQFLFDGQWRRLRAYAHKNGISIIGDVPIYVALDSADVWSEPRFFQLNEKNVPVKVAGVPPDAFSDDGQLWGNPLYDWDVMKKDGYGWWIRRIEGAGRFFDMIRIDHFRGFEAYWSVPAEEDTAKNGKWIPGPGKELIRVLKGWFPNLKFIAEDLGEITPGVRELLQDSGWPGMKVLEFAFGGGESNEYLPHNHVVNSICYIGTHDNDTVCGWLGTAKKEEILQACRYLGVKHTEELPDALIRAALMSVSYLTVIQIQDWLKIGVEGRVNTPGTTGGNWSWRLLPGQITDKMADEIYEQTLRYQRCARRPEPKKEKEEKAETKPEA